MFEIGRLTRLNLGRVGENKARPIEIDVTEWLTDWPGAAIGMLLRRPGEDTYYVASAWVRDGVLHYTPTRADVEIPGEGMAQIVLKGDGDVELRSKVVETRIDESMPGSAAPVPEEPMQPFVGMVIEAAKRAEDAAERAESAGGGGGGGGGDLPTASETVKGGVRVGDGLKMSGDVLSTEVRKEDVDKLSKEMVKYFATVSDMLSDKNLTAGQLVRTGGYYAEGDGGHGEYLIVSEATVNPYDTFETANGKYAVLQHNGHINAKQCGLQDNATDGGDSWITYYNGTAKSLDINVKELRVSKPVVMNKTTEIFSSIYPSVCLYWAGSSDAAVFSCFAGDGLHATAYQSTTTVKLHDISINARTAKVGFCLVNIATSNIWNLNVYKGYIGFLMGNSWRNIFGRLHGSTQTYATFYQNEFINTDVFDFSALSTNGSINASVYEMMTSVFSPNGALLMGHGSDNVFHMIEASEISDGENGIGVRFGEHSGTVNTIYCENAVPGAHYDLYVDNLLSTTEGYDYNKGLMINQVRGRRFYLNNNVTIGTLFIEDWVDAPHAQDVVFEGGEQASRVTILNMPAGKYNESNLAMPYGLNGVMQALQKMQMKHSYRLIDTITVEAAEALLCNTEPDGTPYNFDAVYMEFTLPADTAFPGCNMKFYNTGSVAVADPYLSSVSAGDSTRYMIIEVKNEDGFVRETHSKFDAGSNHQALYTTANKSAYKQPAKIVRVQSTQALQPGTIITIYAY